MTSFQIQTMTHSNFDLKIPWFTVSRISKLPSNDFLRKLTFNRIFFFLKYYNQVLSESETLSALLCLSNNHIDYVTHAQSNTEALSSPRQPATQSNSKHHTRVAVVWFNLWRNIYMASFKKLLYYAALMKSTDLLNRLRLFLI